MEREKPFLDPCLNLSILAKSLNVPSALLSRTINATQQVNFNDFINW